MTKLTSTNITTGNTDVTVTLETNGPEMEAETVHMATKNYIARALRAVAEDKPISEIERYPIVKLDWAQRLDLIATEQ